MGPLGAAWSPTGEVPAGVFERAVARLATLRAPSVAAGIGVAMAVCWGLVWVTGGSQRAFSHAFYLPIAFAALRFGLRGALLTSLLAATLAGPLMPLDTMTGVPQTVGTWLTRGVMFLAVGTVLSLSLEAHRRVEERRLAQDVRATLAPTTTAPVEVALVALVEEVLRTEAFHTVYQPIYALTTGRLLGVEALTRFDVEPRRPPDAWFAAARYADCGTELEVAAIRAALRGAAELPSSVELCVNASPSTLADPALIEMMRDADRPITVEITEHAGVEDYDGLSSKIDALRALGVRIAVDDAGAGIASLRHIVQLAPHVIKLDISLTQGVAASPLRRALAGSLIEFAQQTGAQLLVEGIEDAEDLMAWTHLGAHAAQGYLVGRPSSLPVPRISSAIALQPAQRRPSS